MERCLQKLRTLATERGVGGAVAALVGRCRPRVGDDRQHRGAGTRSCCRRKAKEGPQALGRSRGGFSTKLHGVGDGLGNPFRFCLTAGQAGDAPKAIPLLEGIEAKAFRGDRAYDSDAVLDRIAEQGAIAVIPPHPRRIEKRQTDWTLCKERHKIEIMLSMLEQYRRVFSRYDKLSRR